MTHETPRRPRTIAKLSSTIVDAMDRVLWLVLTFFLCISQNRAEVGPLPNEMAIVNKAQRNLKLRCQSELMDLNDQWLEPDETFRFFFYKYRQGNSYFWCDAYGLEGFDEHFDIFGRSAPTELNMTWTMRYDGLYLNDTTLRTYSWWHWPGSQEFRL
ncbi:hypothetical protein AB6A40_000170 [Gnathostoma spinigerum]|uniref:S-protein homolog n=1 Tax=Gnathostoma spinigerum TaxID=75299 RepID=A0ABD6E2T5_9BILA